MNILSTSFYRGKSHTSAWRVKVVKGMNLLRPRFDPTSSRPSLFHFGNSLAARFVRNIRLQDHALAARSLQKQGFLRSSCRLR
jgi:hypothetical protein